MDRVEEPASLIAADKVEGTAIYNRSGEYFGTVSGLMLDKRSGRVVYAVLATGGFLGMGDAHHPLPWSMLTYDTTQGGYVVNLSKAQLDGAPAPAADALGSDRAYETVLHDYYGVQPYWGAGI